MFSLFNSSCFYFSWPLWLSLAYFCRLTRPVFWATFTFAAQWGRHLLLPLSQSHVKCCCIVKGAFAFTCRVGSETSRQQLNGGLHHIWRRPHKNLAIVFAFLIAASLFFAFLLIFRMTGRACDSDGAKKAMPIFVWRDDGHPKPLGSKGNQRHNNNS